MSQEYEQMELDTRPKLVAALQELTEGAIKEAQDMIQESRRQIATENGTATLLNALPDPNYNAVDATSSIVNSTAAAATVLLHAAAEMKRTLNDLYTAEYSEPASTPLEDLAAGAEFQDADPVDPDVDGEEEKED